MSFASATEVVYLEGGLYAAKIQPGWDIFGIANGGYLMSLAARAMAKEAQGRDLVSITGYFTNPGRPGPIGIAVDRVKTGRSFTTLRAEVTTGDRAILTVLGAYAEAGRPLGPRQLLGISPPDLPPPEQCVRAEPSAVGPLPPPFMSKVEVYIHPEDAATLSGERSGAAQIRGWFRLNDGEPWDPLAVVTASDAFPPAVFNSDLPLAWTPTLDLTVHIRDPRPQTWLKCLFRTSFVTGGLLEEDGELWDEEGRLVAQSRQLALVPRE